MVAINYFGKKSCTGCSALPESGTQGKSVFFIFAARICNNVNRANWQLRISKSAAKKIIK